MKIISCILTVVFCLLSTSTYANYDIQKKLASMSLEEKVGQLFFVRAEALMGNNSADTLKKHIEGTKKVTTSMKKGLQRYPVGGVVLFAKNIDNPTQTRLFIADLRKVSKERLIIAIDEEGGRVARLANNPNMEVPWVGNMGSIVSEQRAYLAGHRIGRYLKAYDFDMNFAPVADVLVNPDNKLVNGRSFGSSPEICGIYSKAYIRGLHDFGIMSTVKHFPSHGGWESDSHKGLSESNASLTELRAKEFIAFQKALTEKTEAVMIAHIVFPNIKAPKVPASLNSMFVTDILRKEMGFKGLIITDSLAMDAIVKYYGHAEAAVLALQAGADVLLMPADFAAAHKGVVEAVKHGIVSEARLNEAVTRILYYKYNKG